MYNRACVMHVNVCVCVLTNATTSRLDDNDNGNDGRTMMDAAAAVSCCFVTLFNCHYDADHLARQWKDVDRSSIDRSRTINQVPTDQGIDWRQSRTGESNDMSKAIQVVVETHWTTREIDLLDCLGPIES